jgi:hypothetical protein
LRDIELQAYPEVSDSYSPFIEGIRPNRNAKRDTSHLHVGLWLLWRHTRSGEQPKAGLGVYGYMGFK